MKFIGSAVVLVLFLTSHGTTLEAKIAYRSMAPLRNT